MTDEIKKKIIHIAVYCPSCMNEGSDTPIAVSINLENPQGVIPCNDKCNHD